jgi:hypothetical protein
MRSGTHFEIELEADNNTVAGEAIRMGSESEVLAFAKEYLQPKVGLLVACIGGGVDYGNLIIEVDAQESCNLRALDHRGFFIKGVTVKQALTALEYWLPSQDRTPHLAWQDE